LDVQWLVCSPKNSDANFPGMEKMSSDAVDTWFGDQLRKTVLLQLLNYHTGLGPIMLQIQF